MSVEGVIKQEAWKDANADVWNGGERSGPSERARAAIFQALAHQFRWANGDDWLSSPILEHARSDAYAAYRAAYDRQRDRQVASIAERDASDVSGSAIDRLKAAARRDACEAYLIGLCGPASLPRSDESRRAVNDAVLAGCGYSDKEAEAMGPFGPSKDERALRVYQRAYNEHMRGLR